MINEKILILDTETTNDINCPLVYDVGFIVANLNGTIYERKSFVVREIFLNKELMSSAFFGDKIPQYWDDIKQKKRELKKFIEIRFILKDIMEKYQITKIFAFNCRFDYHSLTNTQRYLTKSKYRYFYPYKTEFLDIMKYSKEVLKNNNDYSKFCKKNNFLTKYGKNRNTAEIVYKYFFQNDFTEEHTGLEDAIIEYQILLQCMKMKRNFDCHLW